MPRSLRVDSKYIERVRVSLRRNGFPSQRALAEELGLALDTVGKFLRGKPVDRAIFEEICDRLSLESQEISTFGDEPPSPLSPSLPNSLALSSPFYQDWGEAPDVSTFYGRTTELATLNQWIIQERCRLVAILGMGGMGKTALAATLAHQVQEQFEYVIWRSLLNAPPLDDVLIDLIRFFSNQQDINYPENLEGKLSRLMQYLRQHRCLMVLDNAESVLQTGTHAGGCIPGYEGYGRLFKQIGDVAHQSCLVITSREKPREVALLDEKTSPVRSLQVSGLTLSEGQEIFKARNCYGADDHELQRILDHYAGNPLALKIVASGVHELFDGDIAELIPFLHEKRLQFGDINDLLEHQLERLSVSEKQIMYWLAINRDPVLLSELEADIVAEGIKQQLLTSIQSLGRRCLIESNEKRFFLQPVVMEFMTCQLVKQVCQEIKSQEWDAFRHYALIKAQSKDYVRQAQTRLILQPIINELLMIWGGPRTVGDKLKTLLDKLREEAPLQLGYVGGNVLNLLRELDADLTGLDLSSLTVWQAYLVETELHDVNFANADVSKSKFTDTLSATLAVTFSPDGTLFAAGNADGKIRVWRTQDGQKYVTLSGHTSWVSSIAFSPDGKTLISGSFDQTIKLWNVLTGECLKTLKGHLGWVWSVWFSPDGQTIASGGNDGVIKLWNVETAECINTLQGHTDWVWSVRFSPDGQTIASSGYDHMIRLWNSCTGESLHCLQGHTNWVKSIAFSPDGQTLISGSHDMTIRLWNVRTGACLHQFQGHEGNILSVACSPDGLTIASSSQDCTVRLWDRQTGQCLKTLQGHPNGIWSVAFHPEGSMVLSGSNDSTVILWDTKTGQSVRTIKGYSDSIRSIAFSPNKPIVATGGDDQTVKLWNAESGECISVLKGHTSWVWSVAFAPDGHTLASSSGDTSVCLWNIQTGQCLHRLLGHTNLVMSVAFSPDGRILASSSTDQTIILWDVSTGQALQTLSCNSQIWSIAFSPDGKTLAWSGANKAINLWDICSEQKIKTLYEHTGLVFKVVFSPDGRQLASSGNDQTAKLWDVQSGECLHTMSHDARIWGLSFSPDGQLLATSSNDSTVKLWDVQTGCLNNQLHGHIGEVWTVNFMPQDIPQHQILATGGQDGSIKFWDITTGACVRTLRDKRPYERMNITGIRGLTGAQRETLKALGAIDAESH